MRPFSLAMANLRKTLLAALKSLLRGRSFLEALFAFWIRPSAIKGESINGSTQRPVKTLKAFLEEAQRLFLEPLEGDPLRKFSMQLKSQFRERLKSHAESMLPSYTHLLPTGHEKGEFLALDVGGSTLRVALVALRGREAVGQESDVLSMSVFKITPEIKKLEGMAFFDWMAARIAEVMSNHQRSDPTGPVPVGMAWSFPIE
jgi:hexokinase